MGIKTLKQVGLSIGQGLLTRYGATSLVPNRFRTRLIDNRCNNYVRKYSGLRRRVHHVTGSRVINGSPWPTPEVARPSVIAHISDANDTWWATDGLEMWLQKTAI